MSIRPDWRKLGRKWSRYSSGDAISLAPVHEVADNVVPETTNPPPGVAEAVVTGITTEFAASEIIYTQVGDLVSAVTS